MTPPIQDTDRDGRMRPIGEVARQVVRSCSVIRLRDTYQPYPRTEAGRRNHQAYVRMFGASEDVLRVNWDLDPIRWEQELEIENAARVAKHMERV